MEGVSVMPGEIECGEEDEEQEPVTDDARNNATPSLVHWTLLPLRQEALLLRLANRCFGGPLKTPAWLDETKMTLNAFQQLGSICAAE